MPLLNINLLAQQQSRVSKFRQAKYAVTVVAGVIIGLQLLLVVFLYSTLALRNVQKDDLIGETDELKAKVGELDKYNNAVYPNMTLTQQVKAYVAQTDSARNLIDNHKYFSLYLSEIASNTPLTVKFDTFTSSTQTSLNLTGRAQTYTDVSRLAESFKQLSFAKNTNIQEARLAGGVGSDQFPIKFSLTIELKSAAELNKLPRPSGKSSPAPRPSASPSNTPALLPGVSQ